jgi:urate oxidase
MPVKIIHDNYGKARVRLMKVAREGERHELQNLTVKIAFEGNFDDVHTTGDNSRVLPTDTMKNTVYTLAHQTREIEEIETFALRLADYFLTNNKQVTRVIIEIAEHDWTRIAVGGEPHRHSFVKGGDEKRTATISATQNDVTVESGIEDLIVLKTTKSGFVGFIKDRYTTLPETTDRIFATSIKAVWRYVNTNAATGDVWHNVRQTIIEIFAEHDSLSVQHTLYAMGEAVLGKFPDVAEIAFSLPNIHCLPIDFTRFGLENENRIFVPTDEPHGLIEARMSR